MAQRAIVLTTEVGIVITTETGVAIIVGYIEVVDITLICMLFSTGQPATQFSSRQPGLEASDYPGDALSYNVSQPGMDAIGYPGGKISFDAEVCD